MLNLIRQPLNVALRVAEGALDASLAIVRAARGLIETDSADTRFGVADAPPAQGPSPASEPPPPARPPPPIARAPTPAPPAPPAEDHVSNEPVPVAEFAEAGAEDGAGPELNIVEPWKGYSGQDVRTIVRELSTASREKLATVELYESTHKKRRSVADAAERRLKALSAPAGSRTR